MNDTAKFHGTKDKLNKIIWPIMFKTLLTLGIYRFWGKTKLRQYYWANTEINGSRFEYTGTGMEKLLGFMIAIVFISIYLAIVNVLLSYAGMRYSTEDELNIAFLISIYSLIPFGFYASYRALRYRLSRTRFQGIRLAMEKGAWSYTFRAIGHTLLSAITLGLAYPWQVFNLEKFKTNRMRYGNDKFTQEGNWKMLFRPFLPVLLAWVLFLLGGVMMAYFAAEVSSGEYSGGLSANMGKILWPFLWFGLAYIYFIFAFLHFSVRSFRIMTAHKRLGDHVQFKSAIKTGTIIKIFVLGVLAMYAIMIVGVVIITPVMAMGGAIIGPLVAVLFYVLMILGVGVLNQLMIMQPMARHYISNMTIINVEQLSNVEQRPEDDFAEADGFADALDIGAGF